MEAKWQFWIDRGGTFTDIVALDPEGKVKTAKLLSEDPARYPDAAIEGIRRLLDAPAGASLPADRIHEIRMGTTVATNALLERQGAPTLLAITRGFADALKIGSQNRPHLFDLKVSLPEPLYDDVVEIEERLFADGRVDRPLDDAQARAALAEAHARGYRAVAIVLMHGYRYPAHEQRLAEIAREIGFTQIATGHGSNPLMKLIPRGHTTIANAYLSPILKRYVAQVTAKTGETPLYFMQSSGGLARADMFEGKDAVLSGPAGGVVGAVASARQAGFDKLIGFDMGGTSTDVMHYAGDYERAEDALVAGVKLRVPMLSIHTVAAGGGSKLGFDGVRFRVGPGSAGANPGPASYGKGGPLTITDCHVALGRLNPAFFPKVFGADGQSPLDAAVTRAAFTRLSEEINAASGRNLSIEAAAEGFLDIAVEHMARAVKTITIERGHDIRQHVLVSFGGAGGQLACRVAARLGVRKVFIHPLSGLLSALGIGLADVTVIEERSVEQPLDDAHYPGVQSMIAELDAAAKQSLTAQGADPARAKLHPILHLKYAGSDSTLEIPAGDPAAARDAFAAAHKQRFGFAEENKQILIERLSLIASVGQANRLDFAPGAATPLPTPEHAPVWVSGSWRDAPFHRRRDMRENSLIEGPAVILEDHSTTIVEPGWHARMDAHGNLVLDHHGKGADHGAQSTALDPILLEVFNHRFMSIAEQMGTVLAQTAHSVNIKERLDFSCAVFDGDGELVANAPHMPVHLGSMGEAVKALIRAVPALSPGDAYALNDPYHGGTHLPDITVISPVFLPDADSPAFFVASRGHHADIGGVTPGSMPANSTRIEEEGIRFTAFRLLENGRFNEAGLRAHLADNPYPARKPDQNIADLKAQLAANEKGQKELLRLIDEMGIQVVKAYMMHIQDAAEQAVRRAIGALKNGEVSYPLDIGAEIRVKLEIDRERQSARIDFTGTSAQGAHNFNAPLAITRAAVLYAFRCLVDDDIPLNAGCLKPIELIVPLGSMLNPEPPAAVVAGNVETSQAVTNALFLAMGVAAASQGTMNNLTFGNSQHQYYETLAGGTGAGPDFDGADAVHSHMTNSRLTDPEILEWRHPVLLERFAIRRGSGGPGRHHGGDGLIRDLRFLEPMSAAILSNHRKSGPPGLNGGSSGEPGLNRLIRKNGETVEMDACAAAELETGDRLVIETPGGGGYGRKP